MKKGCMYSMSACWSGGLDYIHRKVATSPVTIATLCKVFFSSSLATMKGDEGRVVYCREATYSECKYLQSECTLG